MIKDINLDTWTTPMTTPRRRMLFRGAAIGALMLCISGCKFAGAFAKESVVAAASHRGWETFTFKGQLPAEFGIDVYALYSPDEPDKASCQAPTLALDKTVTRRHSQQYTAAISDQPQAFSFDIPLNYTKGVCGMKLVQVELEINGRHGPQNWQEAYGRGRFYFNNRPEAEHAAFDENGVFKTSATCKFYFQQSVARSRYGEIEKLLSCRGAGGEIRADEIANKTVELKIEVNPEEEPSRHDTWIKFPYGWKPCLPRTGFQRCQVPALFKTFQMDGQTCTVYPGCTE